jgi:hypothetical protein
MCRKLNAISPDFSFAIKTHAWNGYAMIIHDPISLQNFSDGCHAYALHKHALDIESDMSMQKHRHGTQLWAGPCARPWAFRSFESFWSLES